MFRFTTYYLLFFFPSFLQGIRNCSECPATATCLLESNQTIPIGATSLPLQICNYYENFSLQYSIDFKVSSYPSCAQQEDYPELLPKFIRWKNGLASECKTCKAYKMSALFTKSIDSALSRMYLSARLLNNNNTAESDTYINVGKISDLALWNNQKPTIQSNATLLDSCVTQTGISGKVLSRIPRCNQVYLCKAGNNSTCGNPDKDTAALSQVFCGTDGCKSVVTLPNEKASCAVSGVSNGRLFLFGRLQIKDIMLDSIWRPLATFMDPQVTGIEGIHTNSTVISLYGQSLCSLDGISFVKPVLLSLQRTMNFLRSSDEPINGSVARWDVSSNRVEFTEGPTVSKMSLQLSRPLENVEDPYELHLNSVVCDGSGRVYSMNVGDAFCLTSIDGTIRSGDYAKLNITGSGFRLGMNVFVYITATDPDYRKCSQNSTLSEMDNYTLNMTAEVVLISSTMIQIMTSKTMPLKTAGMKVIVEVRRDDDIVRNFAGMVCDNITISCEKISTQASDDTQTLFRVGYIAIGALLLIAIIGFIFEYLRHRRRKLAARMAANSITHESSYVLESMDKSLEEHRRTDLVTTATTLQTKIS